MEMTLNYFEELDLNNILEIEGGTFWGVVNGAFGVVAGAAGCVGGALLLATPEPTGLTKVGGYAAVAAGASGVIGGIATIANNI